MSANAQTTTPFETVFDACKKACEALDGGFASGEQLLAVSKTLRDAAPIPLTVKQTQGDVLSLKGHLVFDYEFIQACVDNETIYEIADKYAAEARTRGDKDSANKVRLDTKMVAAGQTCTFEIPSCSGTSQIGCVAEVNRSFSWKIKTIGYLACAVVVHLFCFVLHSAAHGLPKLLPNPWVRAFLGGCVVVVFTLLYGSMRYNGAGMNIIAAAVEQGQALPWDWIVKILLTALTLSSGFKGGEVVPSFFVGATFGCVAAPLLGIPAGFGAALGLAGVFCGASNCVVASLVLAIELFGAQGLWYFAIVCGITYALSGYAGLYHSQLFLTDKLEPEYRIIRGHNHH